MLKGQQGKASVAGFITQSILRDKRLEGRSGAFLVKENCNRDMFSHNRSVSEEFCRQISHSRSLEDLVTGSESWVLPQQDSRLAFT